LRGGGAPFAAARGPPTGTVGKKKTGASPRVWGTRDATAFAFAGGLDGQLEKTVGGQDRKLNFQGTRAGTGAGFNRSVARAMECVGRPPRCTPAGRTGPRIEVENRVNRVVRARWFGNSQPHGRNPGRISHGGGTGTKNGEYRHGCMCTRNSTS